MRAIFCDLHQEIFRGHGTSRVMGKMVFNFCEQCWKDRDACEDHMRSVSGIPETGFQPRTLTAQMHAEFGEQGFYD